MFGQVGDPPGQRRCRLALGSHTPATIEPRRQLSGPHAQRRRAVAYIRRKTDSAEQLAPPLFELRGQLGVVLAVLLQFAPPLGGLAQQRRLAGSAGILVAGVADIGGTPGRGDRHIGGGQRFAFGLRFHDLFLVLVLALEILVVALGLLARKLVQFALPAQFLTATGLIIDGGKKGDEADHEGQ